MKNLFFILGIIFLANNLHAQFMGRIMDRARQKVEQRIEDKIIEEVSEAIARRAYRPVEKAIDDALRQKYQDSVQQGQSVDWEKMGKAYAAFLTGLNNAANIPDQYIFDLTQEVEIIDYNKQRSFVKLHYSENQPVLGIENPDNFNNTNLVVLDLKSDVMVIFSTDSKGKKTAQAVPGYLAFSSSMAAQASDKTAEDFQIRKTGSSKKVAGYPCDEYNGESKEEIMKLWVTESFPTSHSKALAAYLQKYAPPAYAENTSLVKGMVLQSENTRKDEPGKKFLWTTKKISPRTFEIRKSDYEFAVASEK